VFRIEVFVDDKKLAAFLNAAAGLVASMSPPLPVVNLASNHTGLKAATTGSLPQMIIAHLKQKKLTTVTAKQIREYVESIGRSPKSYGYILTHLKEHKVLKMTRERGKYQVIG
jgi:hypothetical protein